MLLNSIGGEEREAIYTMFHDWQGFLYVKRIRLFWPREKKLRVVLGVGGVNLHH